MTYFSRTPLAAKALLVGAALTASLASRQARADYQPNKYVEPGTNLVLEYNLYVPAGVTAGQKYPLLVYLHAANNDAVVHRTLSADGKGWVPQLMTADAQKTVAYYMIPISQTNDSGWGDPVGPITDEEKFEGRLTVVVLKQLLTQYPIDPDRLYVTGASMGARGTWDMLRRYPDLFAAGAPCASPASPVDAPIYVKQNIWSVNGSNDPVVQPNRDTIAEIRKECGNPIYTELAGHGHDSWRSIYPMPEFIAWMFAQRRGVPWDKGSMAPTPAQLLASEEPPKSGLTAGQAEVVTPVNCPGAWQGGTSAGGTSAGGTSAGGTSSGGTSAGGTSSGGTGAAGTAAGGASSGGTSVGGAGDGAGGAAVSSDDGGGALGNPPSSGQGGSGVSGGTGPVSTAGSAGLGAPAANPGTVSTSTNSANDSAGCGCRVTPRAAAQRGPMALFLLLGFGAVRRGRRRRSAS